MRHVFLVKGRPFHVGNVMPKTIWFIKKGVCNCSRNERRTKTSEKKGKMMRDSAKKYKQNNKQTRDREIMTCETLP